MKTSVNTERRFTPEDVAQYLSRCRQYGMAAAVRDLEARAHELTRQHHDLLMEVTRLRLAINPQGPTPERVSNTSEWD